MKLWLKSFLWPFADINAALPKTGTIIDLGCGDGLVACYLAGHGSQRHVIGIDLDSVKINQARAIKPKLKNLKFITQDITRTRLNQASGCLVSDVLHHLSKIDQLKLLRHISRQLKPGAICLIKEADKSDFIRSRLTRLWDWLLYPHDQINYYASQTLIKLMRQLRFSVKFMPLRRFFPGSVNLFVCTKV